MRLAIWGMQRTALGLGLAIAMFASVFAIDLAKDTGLRLAPVDSDIFVGTMQLQEQWKRLTECKLYRDVSNVPIVEKLTKAILEQWNNREGQVGKIRDNFENPNVESLVKLAQEMFSDEVFMFADSQASDFILGINSLSNEIMAIVGSGDDNVGEAMLEYFMQLQKSEIDDIPVPTFVMGFKVKDQERVIGKIDELTAILRFGLGAIPMAESFANGLERVEDARGTRLSWSIIPEMVPWAQLRDSSPAPQIATLLKKLEELVEGRQLCLTIGQLDGYLVFTLSEDQETITKLGTDESLLKNDDMRPLLQKANEQITSVAYISDAYADAQFQSQLKGFFSRQFSLQYQPALRELLGLTADEDLPEGFDSIPDSLALIDDQIEELVPDFQGQTVFAYLTKTGSEAWGYARTENVVFDATKPLSVLEHVGSNPIAMFAFRLQDRPEYFATARRIVREIKEYLDLIPELEILSDSEREAWEVGLDRGWPLVVELADIWEKKFMPAMKDGQHAWVLQEGNIASKQWAKDMPESSKPLPIPDIATITGLSSKEAMTDAWSSLFELFDSTVDLVRELEPNSVPAEYKVPRPIEAKSTAGEKYNYPIPSECPVPKEMNPHVLLTDSFMISSYSDQQTDALVKSQVLAVGKGVIAPNQPCCAASYLDLGKLSQFAKPWIVYAIETSKGSLDEVLIEEAEGMPSVKGTDIVELWSAFSSAGQIANVATGSENGGTVTRSVFIQE